jgi:hypothetical protein
MSQYGDFSKLLVPGGIGAIPTTFRTTAGDAIPALNILTLTNGANILMTGAGSAVTVALSATPTVTDITATNFYTSVLTAGCTLSGNTWSADGTDGNIDLNITPKGTGELNLTTGDFDIVAGNLHIPDTAINGTAGVITFAGSRFISKYGGNTYVGYDAGSVTSGVLAITNCGFGFNVLHDLVGGFGNSGYGDMCLSSVDNGVLNSGFGLGVFNALKGGSRNVGLGYLAGNAYVGNETGNIIIGSDIAGTAGESNKLRIGNGTGVGNGQIDAAYISGIYGATCGITAGVTLTDSVDKLSSLSGTAGQVLQGGAKPVFSTCTYPSTVALGDVLVASALNVVGVANNVANAGYLLTANLGAAPTFQAPPAGVVYASDAETIAGTEAAKAVAPSSLKAKLGLQTIHALPIGASDTAALGWLAVGGANEILIGNAGADASWSSSPTVTTMKATTFDTNITAAGTTLSGTTWAADGTDANIGMTITPKGTGTLTLTTGDMTISSGNILLPTSTATVGQIQINAVRYFHNYNGTCVGGEAGNFTGPTSSSCLVGTGTGKNLSTAGGGSNGLYNTFIGESCANNASTCTSVTTIGYLSCNSLTTGQDSLYAGRMAGYSNVSGVRNIYLGSASGYDATGSHCIYIGTNHISAGESNVLKIGSSGVSFTNINSTYIDGIYNTAVGATAGVVLSDSADKLGGLAGAVNTVLVGGTKPSFTTTPQCTDLTLTGDLILPKCMSSTTGVIYGQKLSYDGTSTLTLPLMHTYGEDNGGTRGYNLFIGYKAGNFTLTRGTARGNTGVGHGLHSAGEIISAPFANLTTGQWNTAYGFAALGRLTTGSSNTCLGAGNLSSLSQGSNNTACGGGNLLVQLTTGNYNTAMGRIDDGYWYGSGANYTTESSNITICNVGTVADANCMRLGTSGSGNGETNKTFIAGIYGVTPGATLNVALVNSSGQLGSAATLPPSLGGAMTWTEVTGTSQAAAVNNGYIASNVALVTVTLPATAAVGQKVAITGKGAGLWSLAQNAGQTVHFGSFDTTPGVGGSITASVRYDCIEVQCTTANTDWVVIRSVGALVIV